MPDTPLSFCAWARPALLPGVSYTVGVDQRVEADGVDARWDASATLAVSGRRFALEPGDVDATWPPEMTTADYGRCLPQVVLASATLPWERTAGGGLPWLALLVFDSGDSPPPGVVVGTVADLVSKGGRVSYPSLPLELGQAPSTPCAYIDVDAEVFRAIAPSSADLPFLAHVRRVEERDYAVLLGNRLPQPGSVTTVHLVSLEGMAPLLADLGTARTVRLVTLRSWSFSSVASVAGDLAASLSRIGVAPPTLSLDSPKNQRSEANGAFRLGYVPRPHATRTGDTTVSWYRGPLAPYAVTAYLRLPLSCADEALIYDPQTGMFDVSYAAAWQLGQLLAIRDTSFAVALYNWKMTQRHRVVLALEGTVLGDNLGGSFAPAARGAVLRRRAVTRVAKALKKLPGRRGGGGR